MTSSTETPIAAGPEFNPGAGPDPETLLPEWTRVAVPGRRAPRLVRVLTGVSESVLDRMPTERSRYTALACVMIGTALIGGISMYFALSEMVGGARFWFVPLALFWAGFVLCLDRWLVASMAGHRLYARMGTALLRLCIAMVFGFLIAEPLVLKIFDTAITAQVHTERQQNIDHLRSALAACNPASGAQPTTAGGYNCANLNLSIPTPSTADQTQIADLTGQASTLQDSITAETTQANVLMEKVNEECNGVKGTGLTGHAGNGPACQQDERAYQDFLKSHPIAQQSQQLMAMQANIATLQGTSAVDSKTSAASLQSAIDARIAKEPAVYSPIGLIERINALDHLAAASTVVAIAAWLLRLFFVLIDCMPVLVKFASGVTPYDELAGDLVTGARQIARREIQARDEAAEKRISAELDEVNAQSEKRRQTSDFGVRRHAAQLEAQELAAVDEDYQRRMAAAGKGQKPGGYGDFGDYGDLRVVGGQ